MNKYTILSALAVDLLATSGDITQAWTSPAFSKLKSNDTSVNPLGSPISSEDDAGIGSILNIGAMMGAIPFAFIADKIGRKKALLSLAIPHIAAYLIFAFSQNVYLFYFGRFINGFAEGASYTILPMYMAEIAEDSYRGALSVSLNVFWSFGNFLPVAIGPYMSMKAFNIVLACFPLAFLILFLIYGTETPYYYAKTNNNSKMEEVLMRLRSKDKRGVQKELELIKETLSKQDDLHVIDIFVNPGLRKALIISMVLIGLQSFSGICAIQYYMQLIFDASGSKLPSDISSSVCGAWLMLTSVINMYSTDKFGRKRPLIISCFGMCVSLVLLGGFFYIDERTNLDTSSIFWLPIFSILLFYLMFQFGYAAMPWTISSELFPNNVKGISAPAVSAMCWFSSFIVTQFFDNIVDWMGRDGCFWLFAGFAAVAAFFTIFCVPETNGKSFSEIHDMLVNKVRSSFFGDPLRRESKVSKQFNIEAPS